MDRLSNYYSGNLDSTLKILEEQNIDIREYIEGLNEPHFDIIINKKKYKIFQVEELERLKHKISEFEKERLRKEIIDKTLKEKEIDLSKVGRKGTREINKYIDTEINKIYNNVIQNYNLKEYIENKGFIDIVYDNKSYKIAPDKVGRPTEKTKEYRLNVRLTENQYNKLKKYAEDHSIKISKAIRNILDYEI